MASPSDILTAARSWLGVPYRKAGTCRLRGVDCLNFVGLCFVDAGILSKLPAPRDYSYGFWRTHPDLIGDAIREGVQHFEPGHTLEFLRPPRLADLRPGDVLSVCQLRKLDRATHVVIVESVDPSAVRIIHARQGLGGCVERSQLNPRWRVLSHYRILSDG